MDVFYLNFYCVKELAKKEVLFQGKSDNGLYKIKGEVQHNKISNSTSNIKSSNVNPVFAVNAVTFEKLHSRLGHPSKVVMNKIKRDTNMNVVRSHSKCKVCRLGKSHKLLFHNVHVKVIQPFDLIYTDFWTITIILLVLFF